MIHPVPEESASPEVLQKYQELKQSLKLPIVPLFFTYIGAFPEYLSYITRQVVPNISDARFLSLTEDTLSTMGELVSGAFPKHKDTTDWITTNKQSPAFYHFQQNIKEIQIKNIMILFIFMAIREAIKGWAVGAKQIPSTVKTHKSAPQDLNESSFVYSELYSIVQEEKTTASSSLAASPSRGIEKDLMGEYLRLCRFDFDAYMKKESFVFVRLGLEKLVLSSISLFPHPIVSPVNIVYQLTTRYPDFPELLHLLSDHFPTYAMHRAMFGAYIS